MNNIKDILDNLSIYETLAHIFVGLFLLILIYFNDLVINNNLYMIANFDAEHMIMVLVSSYIVGHLVQSVASIIFFVFGYKLNISFFRRENIFFKYQQDILDQFKEITGLNTKSYDVIWSYMIAYTKKNDYVGEVHKFLAYYGLARGWSICFLIASLASILQFAQTKTDFIASQKFWMLILCYILGSIVLLIRTKKYWRYTRQRVFQSYILTNLSKNTT